MSTVPSRTWEQLILIRTNPRDNEKLMEIFSLAFLSLRDFYHSQRKMKSGWEKVENKSKRRRFLKCSVVNCGRRPNEPKGRKRNYYDAKGVFFILRGRVSSLSDDLMALVILFPRGKPKHRAKVL